MINTNDTIAAIASGMTASGIGIIRISGPDAFAVLSRIFRPKKPADVSSYPSHTIHYGQIVRRDEGGEEEPLDECLVMIMRGPHTYTTEDTVEIDCHGGPFVMRQVLQLVLSLGVRPAEPGEFTRRAFLGGRIDLSEAEAVMDVIASTSRDALRSSLSQLGGSVRREIVAAREVLIEEMAFIEAALDDPEHYELDAYRESLLRHLETTEQKLGRLSASYAEGRLIREGILTVILGKPNAGKSSLLNLLCGTDRAIVTELEGTTRDVLEETVNCRGLALRIRDTAGIRRARDKVEEIGVEKARENAAEADLILAVFDASRVPDDNDRAILELIRQKRAVILLNKSDLPQVFSEEDFLLFAEGEGAGAFSEISGKDGLHRDTRHDENISEAEHRTPVLAISARTGEGLDALEQTIREMFFGGQLRFNEEAQLTSARQKSALDRSLSAFGAVHETVAAGLPEDLLLPDLMDAYSALGEIIGEEVDDDLIDTVFAKFCMGK